MKNNFKGGMSANMTAFDVAKKWKISPIEFMPILEKGTEHEMEHTDNEDIARRIALDHIVERLDYYDKLEKIEKMKKGAVLETSTTLNDIVLYYEKKGNWLFSKGNFYAWLYDEKGVGKKLESGEYDFIMFPPMGKGSPFSDRYVPPLLMVWQKTYQKNHKGSEHLLGIVKGFYDEDKNHLIIEMMTTNPKFRRQGINAHLIKQLRTEFGVSQEDVIFDKPTKQGKSFEISKKYNSGGETDRNFNDKELLRRYKNGESIGFTAIAHLKSKGLIPRADGQKRKSEKYMEDGGINLSNKELMANDFVNEQKELQRNSKYAILLDATWSNYTNEMREVYRDLQDEITKKLGYNPLVNYSPFSDNVILTFDDDSNLLGALEFTIEPQYTEVPRYSPSYIKPEPIFENNNNVFFIEYLFSFAKGNGQKIMNKLKQYAHKYNVDIGLYGSVVYREDQDKFMASDKHLQRFYDKQGFINVIGHYFLYSPNSMAKGGVMSYREYVDSQFNEETDKYLPSGYLQEFEILRDKKDLYPILYRSKNGFEYRIQNNTNSQISVFDGDKMIGYADNKAIMVAPSYQKKGIGLELVTILKERNPEHRFGSMTPEGWNLLGKYYDEKIAKKSNSTFAKGGRTIAQTPAPASDRVSGSKTNPKGSASDTSLARSIKFNDSLLKAIENKVKAHNEEYPSKKVTTPTAKAVVRRGMGAYSKSHRPFITGGAPNSRQAWGLARLNKFLLKKRGVKVKSAYIQDDDLL